MLGLEKKMCLEEATKQQLQIQWQHDLTNVKEENN